LAIQRDDEDILDRFSFLLVVGPFAVALSVLGFSLVAISFRFFFDVVLNAGRLP